MNSENIIRTPRHDPSRRSFLRAGMAVTAFLQSSWQSLAAAKPAQQTQGTDRQYWIGVLERIAKPVLSALGQRTLRLRMPVETSHNNADERRQYTHLEALGRLLSGMAPWLESGSSEGAEGMLRREYADLARQAIASGVDPASADYMNFSRGSQPLVDAAFLSHAIVRAPTELWQKLGAKTQSQAVEALLATRVIKPGPSNWLLFSAMVEAALGHVGEQWDPARVDYAVRRHEEWYKGDGVYGDGAQFHWDYYNSFVIQPMLIDVLETLGKKSSAWESLLPAITARAKRYAAIQERFISPEGTFPAIGRSLPYRFGAFQLLSQMALRRQLPEGVSPEQVRCALTAVIRRMIEAPGTFDAQGWLTIGFCGHQREIAESYISTGSLYLCSTVLLPLGLPPTDPFWSGPAKQWTSQRIWSGQSIPSDHAIST